MNSELKDNVQDNSMSQRVLIIFHFEHVNDFEIGSPMKDGTTALLRSNDCCSERGASKINFLRCAAGGNESPEKSLNNIHQGFLCIAPRSTLRRAINRMQRHRAVAYPAALVSRHIFGLWQQREPTAARLAGCLSPVIALCAPDPLSRHKVWLTECIMQWHKCSNQRVKGRF